MSSGVVSLIIGGIHIFMVANRKKQSIFNSSEDECINIPLLKKIIIKQSMPRQ